MSTYLRSIPLVALGLCGLFAAQQASAEIKIGYVNFQLLMEEAPQVKASMQSLQNEFGSRQRELVAMQNDLKARSEKLDKEGAIMAEADRVKAEKTLRDMQREFSRKGGEFQDDINTRKNEELGKLQRFILQEVKTYGNAQGYDLVLGDVFYNKPGMDITAQVLDVLKTKPANAAAPAKPPAAAPASAPAKPAGAK
ncbi:MAG TPA: OmpH family outer membrane protein [Steroidobacteraceae bacterium]|jgi:outer membrane protein